MCSVEDVKIRSTVGNRKGRADGDFLGTILGNLLRKLLLVFVYADYDSRSEVVTGTGGGAGMGMF